MLYFLHDVAGDGAMGYHGRAAASLDFLKMLTLQPKRLE